MSAAVTYEGVRRGADEDDAHDSTANLLFSGQKFWFSHSIPQRKWLIENACRNGAVHVDLENQADIRLVDHVRKNQAPGTYSYRYIEKSIQNGRLEHLEDHAVGAATRASRPVGSVVTAPKGGRAAYTEEEDQFLWNWMKPFEVSGGSWKGNQVYKQIEAVRPRHTFQSWRDRWIKHVRFQKRQVTADVVPATSSPRQLPQETEHVGRSRVPNAVPVEPRSSHKTSQTPKDPRPEVDDEEIDSNYTPTSLQDAVKRKLVWPPLPLTGTFTQAEATELYRASEAIMMTDEKNIDQAWTEMTQDQGTHTKQEWITYFERVIFPEHERRGGVLHLGLAEQVRGVDDTRVVAEAVGIVDIPHQPQNRTKKNHEVISCTQCFSALHGTRTVDAQGRPYCKDCAAYLRAQSPRKHKATDRSHLEDMGNLWSRTETNPDQSPSPSKLRRPEPNESRKRTGKTDSQTTSQESEISAPALQDKTMPEIQSASRNEHQLPAAAPRTPDRPTTRVKRDEQREWSDHRSSKRPRLTEKSQTLEIPPTPEAEEMAFFNIPLAGHAVASQPEFDLPEMVPTHQNEELEVPETYLSRSQSQRSKNSKKTRLAELEAGAGSSPITIRLVSDHDPPQFSSSPQKTRLKGEAEDSTSDEDFDPETAIFETAPDVSEMWDTAPNTRQVSDEEQEEESDNPELDDDNDDDNDGASRVNPLLMRSHGQGSHMQPANPQLDDENLDIDESPLPENLQEVYESPKTDFAAGAISIGSANVASTDYIEIEESTEREQEMIWVRKRVQTDRSKTELENVDRKETTSTIPDPSLMPTDQEAKDDDDDESTDSGPQYFDAYNLVPHGSAPDFTNLDDWMQYHMKLYSNIDKIERILVTIIEATTLDFYLGFLVFKRTYMDWAADAPPRTGSGRKTSESILAYLWLRDDVKGVWTKEDDTALFSRNPRLIRRLREKHGQERIVKRFEFYEEMVRE